MATPRPIKGLTDEEVGELEAPAQGMTDDEVEAQSASTGDRGSPLEKAMREQSGDVVTVETPTGPAKFTRSGARFYDPSEAQQVMDGGGARLRERSIATLVNTLGKGGLFGPQQAGLMGVLSPKGGPNAARSNEGLMAHYARIRDRASKDLDGASRTSDLKVKVGNGEIDPLPLAASVLPSIVAPNPASWLARIAASGALGAEQAASSSPADLTKGQFAPFLRDTGRGLGTGLAAGGVVEGVTAPMRLIAKGAASRIGDAAADQAARDAAAVEKEIASLRGQLGGESQKMSRMFENTQRAAGGGVAPAGASPIDPALQSKALLALSDPSTVRLQEKVLNRTLGEMPGQTAVVERLERELAQKAAGASQEAAKRTSDYFAKPVFATEIAPRLGRLAYNAGTGAAYGSLAGAGMGMGSMLSGVGDPFTAAAVGLGTGITQGLGKSAITMSRNAAASPRLQAGALEALIGATQASRKGMQGAVRASELTEEDDKAIQAFLTGG